MGYVAVDAKIAALLIGLTPTVEAPRKFARFKGGADATNASAVSGSFRQFELIPGAMQRGAAVNGTGPRQLIQVATLRFFYPTDKEPDMRLTIQADTEQVLACLENVGNYDFPSTGLQNIAVGAASVLERIGGLINSMPLTLTYYGTH